MKFDIGGIWFKSDNSNQRVVCIPVCLSLHLLHVTKYLLEETLFSKDKNQTHFMPNIVFCQSSYNGILLPFFEQAVHKYWAPGYCGKVLSMELPTFHPLRA